MNFDDEPTHLGLLFCFNKRFFNFRLLLQLSLLLDLLFSLLLALLLHLRIPWLEMA
jgi:hypothetical protein